MDFVELRTCEVAESSGANSRPVQSYSSVTTLGQQGTEAEPARQGVLRLTCRVGVTPGAEGVFTRPQGRGF